MFNKRQIMRVQKRGGWNSNDHLDFQVPKMEVIWVSTAILGTWNALWNDDLIYSVVRIEDLPPGDLFSSVQKFKKNAPGPQI